MKVTSQYKSIKTYQTSDGSEIRELVHPDLHHNTNQSLAEAIVYSGEKTHLHFHKNSEEIYYITAGKGLMTLDQDTFNVVVGDSICIKPGSSHCIENIGSNPLQFLCMCAPAYSHDDTHLV
jgi:mannose-6-phosphate isomerase-like protein (cupin superfamily)